MTKIEQMVEQVAESYNSFPYDSHAFKWCSPAYIRAAAYLYGVDLPPVQNARVLEIGCASGGNSLPFAFMYPEAEILSAPQSPALRARLAQLQFDVNALRDCYRTLRAGQKINVLNPRECAMAYVLQSMELITLQPAPQLLPMRKASPTEDPLYRLILNGGN